MADEHTIGGCSDDKAREKEGSFQVFRIKLVRETFLLVPVLLVLIAAGVLLVSTQQTLPGHLMFSTGLLTAALSLLTFTVLMQKIPWAFDTLWCRGILVPRQPVPLEPGAGICELCASGERKTGRTVNDQPCRMFLKETEDLMNGPLQWVVAEAFMILPLTWFVSVNPAGIAGNLPEIGELAIDMVIAFFIGLVAWRMVVMALQVLWLPKTFRMELQPCHPDQCGGLEPLGTLCLWNALIIALPGIYLGGWIAIGPVMGFQEIATLYRPVFVGLLVVPLAFSLVTFIAPLWNTHDEMIARKAEILKNLDELAECINRKNRELLTFSHDTDPKSGVQRIKSLEEMQAEIDSLQKIYTQNRKIPEWPLNTGITAKYLGSQAVPFLTLIGVNQKFIDVITFVIGFLNGRPG